jgi:DNA/RNA-binding domain of Phe-tRNA-synthetase-like protein
MNFNGSPTWRSTYPGAMIGVLALSGVSNPAHHPDLEARKVEVEARLRHRYGASSKAELRSHPVLQAYGGYYRKFDKTYHVQLQLESIIFKGKTIPSVAALVEAMFMAELEDMLLTAGHDLDQVQGDPSVDVATGTETYVMMNSQTQTLKHGDMFIRDNAGILSSVIYGPAQRARITPDTRQALFTVYAPAGIPAENVKTHLELLRDLVILIQPQARVEFEDILR